MGGVDVPIWLKELPLAPVFHPTDTEFSDPIAYISKIEKEASAFGICKIIPPLPRPSKRFIFSNLNKSLAKSPELGNGDNSQLACSSSQLGSQGDESHGEVKAKFTTRHQELGYSLKQSKGLVQKSIVHKQVWQSGEAYTLEQFESKSKAFARRHLGTIKDEVTPLVVESMFWKAALEKPIYVEYANDVPGSGFGEPEAPNSYLNNRHGKRKYSQNYRRNRNCEKTESDTGKDDAKIVKDKYVSTNNDRNPSSKAYKRSPNSESPLPDEDSRFSKNRISNGVCQRECMAGRKLSNSPWNLQAIARSPGSLTRYMLDDIPGVTSPMIYIGMLFSWFAWHVEDHELHSMNYLHTGSSKTWYAVPGDCAFDFEEVIRSKGYGGNVDRLAALTLLGEKTNLLSPDVVVASGIPCCRLVQNPGEFVVTFPRSYHVGFSHGFNCGEAANFGTPQWLKIAKEAAIRRAAMDYLPMLSHQQLLYMLTMSFISRVPRALLPGARSSRLRDRQKEEREQAVKKSFVDDMLNENRLALALLRKKSTSYAVLWDPESLPLKLKDYQLIPSSSIVGDTCLLVEQKDLETQNLDKKKASADSLHGATSEVSTGPIRDVSFSGPSSVDGRDNQIGLTRLYGETVDLYANDNDLPCGVHVDSGTLPCVACGILGFPFMAIVQPRRAAEHLFPSDYQMFHENRELSGFVKAHSPSVLDCAIKNTTSDVKGIQEENQKRNVSTKYNGHLVTEANGKNAFILRSDGFQRPRIFCLEHGLVIEEMLKSKGGSDVLIICHSAYPKIKAHASAVAEEIAVPFDYKDVPLQCASREDLDLINISIDDEEHEEGGEDWTSRMGINLQYLVKLKKLTPSKQDHHALALGGLLSDEITEFDFPNLKWNSQKSRTPHKVIVRRRPKSCKNDRNKEDISVQVLGNSKKTQESEVVEGKTILLYSRRTRNKQIGNPSEGNLILSGNPRKHPTQDVSTKGTLSNNRILTGESFSNSDITSNNAAGLLVTEIIRHDSTELTSFPSDMVLITEDNIESTHEVPDPEKLSDLRVRVVWTNRNSEMVMANRNMEKINMEEKGCRHVMMDNSEMSLVDKTTHENADSNQLSLRVMADPEIQQEEKTTTSDTLVCNQANSMIISDVRQEEITATILVSNQANYVVKGTLEMQQEDSISNSEYLVHNQVDSTIMDNREIHQTDNRSTNELVSLEEASEVLQDRQATTEGGGMGSEEEVMKVEITCQTVVNEEPTKKDRKRRRELELILDNQTRYYGFIRGPCEGLRPRTSRSPASGAKGGDSGVAKDVVSKKVRQKPNDSSTPNRKKEIVKEAFACTLEGCKMSFKTRNELLMHKRNKCTHEGCEKKFRSHKYTILHQRVHVDERPLKCSWEGCKVSFKWAWARTEHLRVHTGERPYKCQIEGCGLTFRYVSDYSRHRRKTGHYVNSPS